MNWCQDNNEWLKIINNLSKDLTSQACISIPGDDEMVAADKIYNHIKQYLSDVIQLYKSNPDLQSLDLNTHLLGIKQCIAEERLKTVIHNRIQTVKLIRFNSRSGQSKKGEFAKLPTNESCFSTRLNLRTFKSSIPSSSQLTKRMGYPKEAFSSLHFYTDSWETAAENKVKKLPAIIHPHFGPHAFRIGILAYMLYTLPGLPVASMRDNFEMKLKIFSRHREKYITCSRQSYITSEQWTPQYKPNSTKKVGKVQVDMWNLFHADEYLEHLQYNIHWRSSKNATDLVIVSELLRAILYVSNIILINELYLNTVTSSETKKRKNSKTTTLHPVELAILDCGLTHNLDNGWHKLFINTSIRNKYADWEYLNSWTTHKIDQMMHSDKKTNPKTNKLYQTDPIAHQYLSEMTRKQNHPGTKFVNRVFNHLEYQAEDNFENEFDRVCLAYGIFPLPKLFRNEGELNTLTDLQSLQAIDDFLFEQSKPQSFTREIRRKLNSWLAIYDKSYFNSYSGIHKKQYFEQIHKHICGVHKQ